MDHISRSKQQRNIVQLCTIGHVEDYKDELLIFCRFLCFFLLQDLKYVLLRLQKAITKVEQGMKVIFSNYREQEKVPIDLCDNPGAWHGRIPNRVRRVCPWQAWCWHHWLPGHISHFRVKSFPPLQIISELPITINGVCKHWNLSGSGAICHRFACNRKNRWDRYILVLGLKEAFLIFRKGRGWENWGRVGAPSWAGGVYVDPAKTVA